MVFGPPVVLGGRVWLPDGSGWLVGGLVVVFWVGRGGNGWPAMLGVVDYRFVYCKQKIIIIIKKNISPK